MKLLNIDQLYFTDAVIYFNKNTEKYEIITGPQVDASVKENVVCSWKSKEFAYGPCIL